MKNEFECLDQGIEAAKKYIETHATQKAPPLGVKPRAIAEQERVSDIFQAILRYMTEGCCIPREWLDELMDILNRRTKG